MTSAALHFVVPGSINQRTGGYIYDARMVTGLRRQGWPVEVHELDGQFPLGDDLAGRSLATTLSGLPDDTQVVVDGLALGGFPDVVGDQRGRLRILTLVHLLLADETGLTVAERQRLEGLERQVYSSCSGVVVTSASTGTRVTDLGVAPPHVRVVVPGTDPARPATGPGRGRPPQFFCLASVVPRKGQDVLVRALAMLCDLSWSCVCAGSLTRDPAFARGVQRLVQSTGLSDRISFPGECDDDTVDGLYHTSSVFVLPSHFESYGMVLTEAMARGLPVVTTTGGAIPSTVPPQTGVLVAPGDVSALAAALRDLLVGGPDCRAHDVNQSRAELAAAARRYAQTLPTWDQAVDAFAEAVRELCADR